MIRTLLACAAVLALIPSTASATQSTAPSPASREAMHAGMNVKPTGNPDIDFINTMIPHHEAAIAMAKIQLEKGRDPVLRKIAQNIMGSQQGEIKQMQARLKQLQKK